MSHSARRDQVHMVTQAHRSLSDDISYRQRRYLLMMGIRAACFAAAVLMFVNHLGWLAALPCVGAIIIPYFAVVFANGGREPDNVRGFMEYQPHVPATRRPLGPRDSGGAADANGGNSPGPAQPGTGDNLSPS